MPLMMALLDGGSNPAATGWTTMGFTIDYGPPGIVMIVLIVLGVAGLVIFARFLLSVVNSAHEDVVETDEDDHPT